MIHRRDLLLRSISAFAATLVTRSAVAGAPPTELRIGYQKSSFLAVVREQGLIERRYGSATHVRWSEFQFGPPLLEAMNAGRIDYGYSGNAPPIFAQAAKDDFIYVGALPGRGDNVGILVGQSSPLRTVADLKGHRIAVGKGSSGHDFLIAALDSAGVPYDSITPVYLAPADAVAAFARGAVDAWSIWDPYLAIAQTTRPVRALHVDPSAGPQSAFFLANKTFTESYPDVVKGLNDDVAVAAQWVRSHRDDATRLYSKATGVDLASEKLAVDRTVFAVSPMTGAIIRQQQSVADRFLRIGLIPSRVDVDAAVWREAKT